MTETTEDEGLVDIVEIDGMTGNDRTMWMHVGITREEAEAAVEWKVANITSRYRYEIVPTGTGPDERR
jgi:hypothetical protein